MNTHLFLCKNTFLLNKNEEDRGTGVCLSAVAPMSSLQEMSFSSGCERRALSQQPPHAFSQALNVPPEQ